MIGTPSIGHNSGDMTAAALSDLRKRLAQFARRKRQFLKAAGKVVIRDRADAGSAADLIGLARDVRNLVDQERKAVAGPHDEAVKATNGRARMFWEDVDDAIRMVQAKLDEFAGAEDKRIAAQAREQERELERRRALVAPPPIPVGDKVVQRPADPPPAMAPAGPQPKRRSFRGDYGRQGIVQDVDVIELEDWRKLPDYIFEAEVVREAIRKVAAPLVRQKIVIPGLKVSQVAKTQVRR